MRLLDSDIRNWFPLVYFEGNNMPGKMANVQPQAQQEELGQAMDSRSTARSDKFF